MHKPLFLIVNYVYKACNPTILNLSIVKKKIKIKITLENIARVRKKAIESNVKRDKFRITGLQA